MPRIRAKQTLRAWEASRGATAEAIEKVWFGLTNDAYTAVLAASEYKAELQRMKMENWNKGNQGDS